MSAPENYDHRKDKRFIEIMGSGYLTIWGPMDYIPTEALPSWIKVKIDCEYWPDVEILGVSCDHREIPDEIGPEMQELVLSLLYHGYEIKKVISDMKALPKDMPAALNKGEG